MEKTIELIVTIDGPAGAGKSTAAKAIARKLSYLYLDTGALYRAVAWKILQEEIDDEDQTAISNILKRTSISLLNVADILKVVVNQEDISDQIRTEEIALLASKISSYPIVRKLLLEIQRQAGEQGGIIAEGRDMGSIVFPGADVKFFLDAESAERARRRHFELKQKGIEADLTAIGNDLKMRDKQDSERPLAPLIVPEGAIRIDSTKMDIAGVVETMLNYIYKIRDLRTKANTVTIVN